MAYRKQIRFVFRNLRDLYGYMIGMVVEVAAILVLMGIGLLISVLGCYL